MFIFEITAILAFGAVLGYSTACIVDAVCEM